MEIQDWIVDWFDTNTQADRNQIITQMDTNYFENGWMDSIAFISFLGDLEEHFNITLDNEAFEDRNFSTISGLVEIIGKKL